MLHSCHHSSFAAEHSNNHLSFIKPDSDASFVCFVVFVCLLFTQLKPQLQQNGLRGSKQVSLNACSSKWDFSSIQEIDKMDNGEQLSVKTVTSPKPGLSSTIAVIGQMISTLHQGSVVVVVGQMISTLHQGSVVVVVGQMISTLHQGSVVVVGQMMIYPTNRALMSCCSCRADNHLSYTNDLPYNQSSDLLLLSFVR